MSNNINKNQNLETTQLRDNTQNSFNLTTTPQMGPFNINVNPNNNPQFTQNYNPQCNPQFNPNFNTVISPNITNSPEFKIDVKPVIPKIELKPKRTISHIGKLGLKPKRVTCPYCEKSITTNTETSINMKALCTAIGTCYIGFVLMQACNRKEISCQDCEHSCPECGNVIGEYHAM